MKIAPIWLGNSQSSAQIPLGVLPVPWRQVHAVPLAMTGQAPVVATAPVFSPIANPEMPLMVALTLAGVSCLVVLPMALSFLGELMTKWHKQKPMTGPMVMHHCRIHDPSYLKNLLEGEQVGLGFSSQEVSRL